MESGIGSDTKKCPLLSNGYPFLQCEACKSWVGGGGGGGGGGSA